MADYDKQYKEDLERAQALSLESLALEQFKNKKRLQDLNNARTKTTTVVRASSMTENDSVTPKYDKSQTKSRPRPGTLSGSSSGSLLAPPPSSQRKNSSASTSNDSPDLISFASPPASTSSIIDFCNQQNYSNQKIVTYSSTLLPHPQYMFRPQISTGTVNTFHSTNYPGAQQAHWYRPQFFESSFNQQNNLRTNPPLPTSPVLFDPAKFKSTPTPSSSSYSTPTTEAPPALPPKNAHKQPSPLPGPPISALRSVKPRTSHSHTKDDFTNLIDLANADDKNSVRVSILQEFDPILSDSSYTSTLRTISPECPDDTMSVCESVYDEYDPYDFIYTGSGNNSLSDPLYAAVVRSEFAPQSPPPPVPPRSRMSTIDRRNSANNKVKWSLLDNIVRKDSRSANQTKDSDLKAFYKMVYNVRSQYRYNDVDTNMGLVISPMLNYKCNEPLSIKLIVYPDFEGADFNKPVTFTCDVNTSIEHVTLQLTCELDAPSKNNYTLKVWGYNEYLVPTTFLSDYEYVHNCIKLDEDVLLVLIPDSKVDKSFARTLQDDARDKDLTYDDVIPNDLVLHISYDNLKILLETVENEMKKIEDAALQIEQNTNSSVMPSLQPQTVIQAVKYVVNLMGRLNTLDIMDALESLIECCTDFNPSHNMNFSEIIRSHCDKIRFAIQNLIEMYCRAFTVDFELHIPIISGESPHYTPEISDTILIRVCAIYRPSVHWNHNSYIIAAQIYHGMRPIGHPVLSQPVEKTEDHQWPSRIIFNQWFEIDDVPISSLARESRLVLVIYGRTLETAENEDSSNTPRYKQDLIGWAAVQFFNYEGNLIQGSMLLPIWPKESNHLYSPAPALGTYPYTDHPMVGVELAALPKIEFPTVPPDLTANVVKCDFHSLDAQTQQQLLDVCEQDMLYKLPPDIREVLWEKRHYLYDIPEALPKILLAAHSWAYACLPDLHGMLHSWKPLRPLQALQLLLPMFPDMEVRKMAIRWIRGLTSDELVDYLPQLVVALRHETYENSSLAQFLLDRSLRSPRFAHHLFWLLSHSLPGSLPQNCASEISEKEEVDIGEVRHHRRMKLMLRALLAVCGESLRACFLSQQLLVKELNDVAESVKKSKESHRLTVLHNHLQQVNINLQENHTSLPLSPTLRVVGVQVDSSSYFPSNTLPLKISFLMNDGFVIPAIYKVGDDLQQDMLTLQMVRLMDKLWLNKGLDLKMVAFSCVPTGKKKGMIEMVTKAETLRKIQVEHGLTGSFKDKPIAEWLAKHNPSELEYGRAVQNFTASCAGYCVVTYILGICDRHNDNIMLKTSGHLFHIDFGKFLGDAQMFGNFKRDRTPFVLTSDMAYVINGGDRPTEKFHQFVDLCCQAFNIIRNNANLFLYLFTLMASSGICGVTTESVSYLHGALLPGMSNPEAAAYFAKLIQSSLKSWFTQFNFFLHNLAQLKFSGDHNEGALLSFVPKAYSLATDGRLVHVEVVNYRKRYDPDKYYVYVLRVYRENQNQHMEIQRTYKEFCELHQKLCICFPLAKLHSLSTGLHMGRSNIKAIAEKRFHEISLFVKSLFLCAPEIAHSDLVYTFFHPLLRDQQYENEFSKKLKDRNQFPGDSGRLKGQLKLSLQFSKGVFSVMVHHVRGLPKLANGQEPSTYVKVYLQPDDTKSTKRKTKVVKKNCHPSFMEMLEYRMSLDVIHARILKATVWNYDVLQENEFMGGVELELNQFDLTIETTEWYPLTNLSR